MAWWRERLDELDQGKAPAEPRLQAIEAELLPRGVAGKELSGLEDAWLPLLHPFPWGEAQVEGLALRGRILFGMGARLLGVASEHAEAAGYLWSLCDGSEHCSDPDSQILLRLEAHKALGQIESVNPRDLRPLTTVAALAAADLLSEGNSLLRLKAAILHKLNGRFPPA